MPYQGSGTVPATLPAVIHGMLFFEPSQKSSRFGSLFAALQLFEIARSVDVPPNTLSPCGSRALTLISRPLYDRDIFGSVLSTLFTALCLVLLML